MIFGLNRRFALLASAAALMSPMAGMATEPTSARDFVQRRYFHGIPYEEARSLGPRALPELERMLNDPSMKPRWQSIVGTIAYIGTPRSFAILKDFMWKRFRGNVDGATWSALLAVPNVMGTIRDYPGGEVLQYLERGTNPSFWNALPWSEKTHERHGDLSIVLSKMSINGLACTGTERASVILARLKQKPYSPRQIPNIEEGIRVNQEIRERGLGAYLARMRDELGASAPSRRGRK